MGRPGFYSEIAKVGEKRFVSPTLNGKQGSDASRGEKEGDGSTAAIEDSTVEDEHSSRCWGLFLDLNCMLHPEAFKCLAENKEWTDLDVLERKMLDGFCKSLELLVMTAAPTNLIYVAVDGPAPRAKMMQQRYRRCKSIKDNQMRSEIKQRHDVDDGNFWSNTSLTPGTNLMAKIKKRLEEFLSSKKSEWQTTLSSPYDSKLDIVFSSAQAAGEGEHKIMHYIKANSGTETETEGSESSSTIPYDANLVVYGLDADIFFLTMALERPHIHLMRERREFRARHLNQDGFAYCSIDNLKDVIVDLMIEKSNGDIDMNKILDKTIISSTDAIKIEKNIKKQMIRDFIFICYLLGNDFLPHIPSLDIYDGGLLELVSHYGKLYRDIEVGKYPQIIVLPSKGESEGATINMDTFNILLQHMAKKEHERLYRMVKKWRRGKYAPSSMTAYELDVWKWENLADLDRRYEVDPVRLGEGKDAKNGNHYKARYYVHHFKSYFPATSDDTDETKIIAARLMKCRPVICQEYLNGLRWVAKYYFTGIPSWNWHYPYHHAPLLSDLSFCLDRGIMKQTTFDVKSKPLLPLTQLISVIPPYSRFLLPKAFRSLLDPGGDLAQYCPDEFNIDYLYCHREYLGVPLLPNIPEDTIQTIVNDRIKLIKDEYAKFQITPSTFSKEKSNEITEAIEYLQHQNVLLTINHEI
jgi:5'-3' exonuclease